MKPGLRESFKGFWSISNRATAWSWASEQFGKESDIATDDSREQLVFLRMCNHANMKSIREHFYARNQTQKL